MAEAATAELKLISNFGTTNHKDHALGRRSQCSEGAFIVRKMSLVEDDVFDQAINARREMQGTAGFRMKKLGRDASIDVNRWDDELRNSSMRCALFYKYAVDTHGALGMGRLLMRHVDGEGAHHPKTIVEVSSYDLSTFRHGGIWSVGIELPEFKRRVAGGLRPLYTGRNELGRCLQDIYQHLAGDHFHGFARYDICVLDSTFQWVWAGPIDAHDMAAIQHGAVSWMERQAELQGQKWSQAERHGPMPHEPFDELHGMRQREKQGRGKTAVWMRPSTRCTRGIFSILAPDGMRPGEVVPASGGNTIAYRPHDDPANWIDWPASDARRVRVAAGAPTQLAAIQWWRSFAQWSSLSERPRLDLAGNAMDGVWGNERSLRPEA